MTTDDQPTVDERQGRQWLLDRYDNHTLPPGPAVFVFGVDKWGDRPWEKARERRVWCDHQVMKSSPTPR